MEDVSTGDTALEKELDAKYPNRPHNHSSTLPFHDLFLTLFNPLNDNKAKASAPPGLPRRTRGAGFIPPHEKRRMIIERFFSRWRQQVGNDIYPAFQLILPDKDRDRPMYGLKETAIAKLLVKVMKIDKNSEDGSRLVKWKVPGTYAGRIAGDFAGRCFEVIKKRPIRTGVGDMTIAEVNTLLDRLALASKEETQLPIMEEFYTRMNPEELLWLIRMILRSMKVGASEKTFFEIWHPDAQVLFNVCSSLRQVCWELPDPSIRLHQEECGVSLMQSFQPQMAQFQTSSFQAILTRLRPTSDDEKFWIEEKLDGERMQLHMRTDDTIPGGKVFAFWSRKGKEYTYLYGNGYEDENSALTRHLKGAFIDAVDSIILDGEMITWDPKEQAMIPFGTLKSAAISEQRNPYTTGHRPVFKVFDLLLLNGTAITSYTLYDRRGALETCVKGVPERLEVHAYKCASTIAEVESKLKEVVASGSEGLVLKNPRSMYRPNDRNDDWMKVKPEYLNEYGEDLDCLIVGGYYGTGKRGNNLSSFLCGLRVDDRHIALGADPMKHLSFFKVGGGFSALDYADLRHRTDGKWKAWDKKNPPNRYIELAGGHLQYEMPDMWIKPSDSVVVAIKAAQVTPSDSYRAGLTLRFPRFKSFKSDKDWRTSLSVQEFIDLKNNIEKQLQEKSSMTIAPRRKKAKLDKKRPLTIAGTSQPSHTPYTGSTSTLFAGLTIHIMTDALPPHRTTKAKLTALIEAHGGTSTHDPSPPAICIADKRVLQVASLVKTGGTDIVRSSWLFDAIRQHELDGDARPRFLPPFEPRHFLFATESAVAEAEEAVDEWGNSFCVDIDERSPKAMRKLLAKVPETKGGWKKMRKRVLDGADGMGRGALFVDVVVFLLGDVMAKEVRRLKFGGARVGGELKEFKGVTHVVCAEGVEDMVREMRLLISQWRKGPRIVSSEWVAKCWEEDSRLAEERFAVLVGGEKGEAWDF